MVILRLIFILAVSVSMVAASAPAMPEFHPVEQMADAGCCHHSAHESPAKDHDSKRPCHTQSCAMQCCRLLPVQADARPVLTESYLVVRAELLPLVTLHTLTDPDAIFHPPKA